MNSKEDFQTAECKLEEMNKNFEKKKCLDFIEVIEVLYLQKLKMNTYTINGCTNYYFLNSESVEVILSVQFFFQKT